MLNLISNAYKFTFEGMIRLDIKSFESNRNKMIEFKVEDTGIGIKEEHQSKLFKLFGMIHDYDQQDELNLNPNGSGIGLTVSKKYLEYLNGDINLKSELNKGTTVCFYIPLIKDEPDFASTSHLLSLEQNYDEHGEDEWYIDNYKFPQQPVTKTLFDN